MSEERKQTTSLYSSGAPAEAPGRMTRLFSNLDWVSALSFAVAGVLGIATIANTIRNKFYHAIVLGYKESATLFTPIVEKYTARDTGMFSSIAQKWEKGLMTGQEYLLENKKAAQDFRAEITKNVQEHLNIPTDGIEGWTKGTWLRWKEIGSTARIESAAAFTSVTAVTLGAISLLRHNQRVLNHVEAQLQKHDHETRSLS